MLKSSRKLAVLTFFLLLNTSVFAATSYQPLFYAKSKAVAGLSSDVLYILEMLGDRMQLANFKVLKVRLGGYLNKTQLKLMGIALDEPVILAADARVAPPPGSVPVGEFENPVRFTLQLPLDDPEAFKAVLDKYHKSVNGRYNIEAELNLKIEGDHALVYLGEAALDVDTIVSSLDDKVDFDRPDKTPMFLFKVDDKVLSGLQGGEGLWQGMLAGNAGGLPGNIPPNAALDYAQKIYSEVAKQANYISPRSLGGWLDLDTSSKDSLDVTIHTIGDLKDRPFLKKYLETRRNSLPNLRETGQVRLNIDESLVHITTPLPFRDFIAALDSSGGSEIFLIRDVYQAIFIVTDFLTLSDTRENLWKHLNGSFDLIVYDIPGMTQLRDPGQYKFVAAFDTIPGHNIDELFQKLVVQTQQAQSDSVGGVTIKKIGERLYRIRTGTLTLFVGTGEHIVLIGSEKALVAQAVKAKPEGVYTRSSITFKDKADYDTELPTGVRIDLQKMRSKVFSGQYQIFRNSALFLPGIDALELRYFQNQEAEQIDGILKFKIELSPVQDAPSVGQN